MPERRPYSRGEYNRALIANALLSPFNIVLLATILIVGILLGIVVPLLPVAVVAYLAGAARTYFDDDAANKVLERERSKHGKGVERKRALPENLAPPIARLVEAARQREARIRDAIERAELPYDEVATEVDGFLVATEGTARRAQLLYEALEDTPPERVAARLESVRGDPERAELADALSTQLETLQRMERQLARFYAELERINAVVVLTDGEDTDSSLDADEVVRRVRAQSDSEHQVRIFTIAYSAGAQGAAKQLEAIAKASGGQAYTSDTADIETVYRSISSFF